MVTVMLIGQPDCCEKARALIEEAMDNREQKQQQRQKEYAKKRDAKVGAAWFCPRLSSASGPWQLIEHSTDPAPGRGLTACG